MSQQHQARRRSQSGRSDSGWIGVAFFIEWVIGLLGLALAIAAGVLVAEFPAWVASYVPLLGDNLTLVMQSSVGVFSSVLGGYVNQCFTLGVSSFSRGSRRSFVIVAGASQILTVVLSFAAQGVTNALAASLAGGALSAALQVWAGAALAYLRNLPQVWVFSKAAPSEQSEADTKEEKPQVAPSEQSEADIKEEKPLVGWQKQAIRLAVWSMLVLGFAGSFIGLAGYPIALRTALFLTFFQGPYALEIIQGSTGLGQGWSGTLLNRFLRNRRRGGTKTPLLSREFAGSSALAMIVTAVSAAALQLAADYLTAGATNQLAVKGLAALVSAAVGLVRGSVVAPLAYALVDSKVGSGFRAIRDDLVNVVRRSRTGS